MRTLRKIMLRTGLVTSALGAASGAQAANIVLDPSFELLDGSWLTSGDFPAYAFAHTGVRSVGSACVGPACTSTLDSGAYIQQTLGTVAGQNYDLSFWVSENSGPTSAFSVFWDGNLIAAVTNPANNLEPNFLQFSYSGLLASTGATVLQVHGRQDPGAIIFDDFVVEASAGAVPEPATWAMMLAGFGLTGAALRRRRRERVSVTFG